MRRENMKNRLIGRSPRRTILHLIIASIFVGAVLALLGLSPGEFWNGVFHAVRSVVSAIGNSFGEIAVNLATYLMLGAAIVIPIWLISCVLSGGDRRKD